MSCLLSAAALALLATGASAQRGVSELRGRVSDAQGSVLPGVTIVIRNENTGMCRQVVSTHDGSYFVAAVMPGATPSAPS